MTETNDGPWRILVIDDDTLIATLVGGGLRLLGHEVTVAASPNEARVVIDEIDPHLLICDLNFTDGQSGAEYIAELAETRPWVACVVLSNHRSPELAVADAHLLPRDVVYLVKSTVRSMEHILAAVRAAMTGRALEIDCHDTADSAVDVNPAQAQVLRLLASGASTRALAAQRGTSVRAVESLLVRLYGRLGLDISPESNPRVEAIRMWQAGLVRVGRSSGKEISDVP
jgi:DNA-binding NarL/FixJ family response regulator